MSKRWNDTLAAMPRLTPAQAAAIKDIVDYHLTSLVSDHPPVDDAHYQIQEDIDEITKEEL